MSLTVCCRQKMLSDIYILLHFLLIGLRQSGSLVFLPRIPLSFGALCITSCQQMKIWSEEVVILFQFALFVCLRINALRTCFFLSPFAVDIWSWLGSKLRRPVNAVWTTSLLSCVPVPFSSQVADIFIASIVNTLHDIWMISCVSVPLQLPRWLFVGLR